jgi:hypothetical protein
VCPRPVSFACGSPAPGQRGPRCAGCLSAPVAPVAPGSGRLVVAPGRVLRAGGAHASGSVAPVGRPWCGGGRRAGGGVGRFLAGFRAVVRAWAVGGVAGCGVFPCAAPCFLYDDVVGLGGHNTNHSPTITGPIIGLD